MAITPTTMSKPGMSLLVSPSFTFTVKTRESLFEESPLLLATRVMVWSPVLALSGTVNLTVTSFEDPGLTVLGVQTTAGQPIAVLANYSMHYFGAAPISADYFGRFCGILEQQLGGTPSEQPVVAMMSQGTAGDLHWMDYSQPQKSISIDQYAEGVAESALQVYRQIKYQQSVPLGMAQCTLTLRRRTP